MMESRVVELFTPQNYHTLKLMMQQLLQSKGLWHMLAEEKPMFTKDIEKFSIQNKLDEEMLLIGIHVSSSLLFHVDGCKRQK